MFELVTYLLRLLFEGAVGGFGFVLACRLYAVFCVKSKETDKAVRLLEKLQTWLFGFKLMLLVIAFDLIVRSNTLQTVSKLPRHFHSQHAVLYLFITGMAIAFFIRALENRRLFLKNWSGNLRNN